MKFKFVAAAGMAAAVISTPALAETTYNPDRIVKSVENDDLIAIVKSLDHEIVQIADDSRLVGAKEKDGLSYILIGTACDANGVSGCQGVNMQVRWSGSSGMTDANLAEANLEYAAITSWYLPDTDSLGFSRYVVLDYGITMANLRENLKVLLAVAPRAKAIATGSN